MSQFKILPWWRMSLGFLPKKISSPSHYPPGLGDQNGLFYRLGGSIAGFGQKKKKKMKESWPHSLHLLGSPCGKKCWRTALSGLLIRSLLQVKAKLSQRPGCEWKIIKTVSSTESVGDHRKRATGRLRHTHKKNPGVQKAWIGGVPSSPPEDFLCHLQMCLLRLAQPPILGNTVPPQQPGKAAIQVSPWYYRLLN